MTCARAKVLSLPSLPSLYPREWTRTTDQAPCSSALAPAARLAELAPQPPRARLLRGRLRLGTSACGASPCSTTELPAGHKLCNSAGRGLRTTARRSAGPGAVLRNPCGHGTVGRFLHGSACVIPP